MRVAQQAVTTAQRGVDQLQAKVLAAQAEVKRTQADLQRYSRLLAQEAVTQQNYDSIASQAATAQSNLDSLEQQISQARSQVISAQQTVSQNQANYAAALQSAQAANEQIKVAQAGLAIAKANQFQVGVQNSNVQTSAATNGSSQADIQTAKAGLTQVMFSDSTSLPSKLKLSRLRRLSTTLRSNLTTPTSILQPMVRSFANRSM